MKASTPLPIDRALKPLQAFLRLEAAGGLLLMMTTLVALIVANSPLSTHYRALLDLSIEVRVGSFGTWPPRPW